MKTLFDLIKGDIVIRKQSQYPNFIKVVERVTPAYLEVGGQLFRKCDGTMRGSTVWNSPIIHIPENRELEKTRDEAIIRRNLDYINNVDWKLVGVGGVAEVIEVIKRRINANSTK